jgi:hypothetical protein
MPNVVGSFEVGEPSQDQEDDLELEMSEPEAPQVVVTPTGSGLRTLGVPNRSTIDKDRVTSQVTLAYSKPGSLFEPRGSTSVLTKP